MANENFDAANDTTDNEDDDSNYEVSSELYLEFDYSSKSKPTINSENTVSKFSFKLPTYPLEDSDGDLLVSRSHEASSNERECIELEHKSSTNLNLVGLQVWRGALLLADWLLYHGKDIRKSSKEQYILELGTGVGLSSIVAAMFAPVIATDVNRGDIFETIQVNINRNKRLIKYPVKILELDFTCSNLPQNVVTLLPNISMIIAADVIYDDNLTDALIKTIENFFLIPPKKTLYMALEKRYVFTIKDFNSCAPCYDYFLEKISTKNTMTIEHVECDFPQYFFYDRTKELVLLKITSNN